MLKKSANVFIFLFILLYSLNFKIKIGQFKSFYLLVPIIILFFILHTLKSRKIILDSLQRLYLIFLVISLMGTIVSFFVVPNYLIVLRHFLTLVFIFFLIQYITIYTDFISFSKTLMCVSFFFYGYLFIDDFNQIKNLDYRYEGAFNDPNYFNLLIFLFLTSSFIIFNISKNKIIKLISILLIITSIFFTFRSLSRSGIISLVLYLFIFTTLHIKKLSKTKKIIYIPTIILLSFIIIFASIRILTDQMIFHNIFYRFSMKKLTDYESALLRIEDIKAGLNLIKENPFLLLTGVGTGATDDLSWFGNYFRFGSPRHTRIHNTFFALLVENGIFCLFAFFYLLIKSLNIYNYNNILSKKMNIPLFALICSNIVISQFIWTIYFVPFWISIILYPNLYINWIYKNK